MAKKPSAAQLAARKKFAEAAKAGTLRKKNRAAKKKTAPKKAANRAKKSVKRPSQITKKAPSKRLVKRRSKPKVKGYFANPTEQVVFVVKKGKRHYIGPARSGGFELTTKAKACGFSRASAETLARKIHRARPAGVSAVGFDSRGK